MTIEKIEPMAGGAYRYIHRRGEHSFGFHGMLHEVTAPERMIQTFHRERGVNDPHERLDELFSKGLVN